MAGMGTRVDLAPEFKWETTNDSRHPSFPLQSSGGTERGLALLLNPHLTPCSVIPWSS
jgi:hypothetical protein